MKWNVERGSMKKLFLYIFLGLIFCNVGFADDKKNLPKYGTDYTNINKPLNNNIINYGWKIKSVKITNDKAIYTLSKNKWIMYCVVFFADEEIETFCRIP